MPGVRRTVALISCKKHEMSVRWGSRQSITMDAKRKGNICNILIKIRHQSTASPQVVSAEDGFRLLKVAAKILKKSSVNSRQRVFFQFGGWTWGLYLLVQTWLVTEFCTDPRSGYLWKRCRFYNNNNIFMYLFTAIGLLPGVSGYFTCKQNVKLVTTWFKSGGLHEKHIVATWNLGIHLRICL